VPSDLAGRLHAVYLQALGCEPTRS
jgi:hypothetical protein